MLSSYRAETGPFFEYQDHHIFVAQEYYASWDVFGAPSFDRDEFKKKHADPIATHAEGMVGEVSHFNPQNHVGRGRGIRNGAAGAIRLPKILVLTSDDFVLMTAVKKPPLS